MAYGKKSKQRSKKCITVSCVNGEKILLKKRQLGKGGNGTVHPVFDVKKQYEREMVVKVLNEECSEKRKKRFVKEINALTELKGIEGILPIIEYNVDCDRPWYMMPEAEPLWKFIDKNNPSLIRKLHIMIQIANIIKHIHSRGKFHRDIKPDNILFYNETVHLADFGLVFDDAYPRITDAEEHIGPIYIRPPELEYDADKLTDFAPSDVYLFAKTVWMIIKKDRLGFRGEYNRGAKEHYLKKSDYGVQTLEPIHRMLEGATKDDMSERISIEECIALLNIQFSVLEGTCPILNELVFCEMSNEIRYGIDADAIIYADASKINEAISKLKKYIALEFSNGKKVTLYEIRLIDVENNMFEVETETTIFIMKIAKLTISKNQEHAIETGEIIEGYEDCSLLKDYFKSGFGPTPEKVVVRNKSSFKLV